MTNWISSVAGFRIDGATGTLTDIKQYVNSVDLEGGPNFLDDTGLGDTRERVLAGLATATKISINGSLNSTTEGIFGPIVNGTTVTKTIEIKWATGKYHTGEVWPEKVRIGSRVKEKSVFSVDLMAEYGLTRTSVAVA